MGAAAAAKAAATAGSCREVQAAQRSNSVRLACGRKLAEILDGANVALRCGLRKPLDALAHVLRNSAAVRVEQAEGLNASRLRVTLGGGAAAVYGAFFEGGQGYRIDYSAGVAKGNEPETLWVRARARARARARRGSAGRGGALARSCCCRCLTGPLLLAPRLYFCRYMVTSGTHANGGCCFDYGNAETSNNDTGSGSMESIYFGTAGGGTGGGPWVKADLENGLIYSGDTPNPNTLPLPHPFVTAVVTGGSDGFALKGGDGE